MLKLNFSNPNTYHRSNKILFYKFILIIFSLLINNAYASKDWREDLDEFLKNPSVYTELFIEKEVLTEKRVKKLNNKLVNHTTLKLLAIANCSIAEETLTKLFKDLKKNHSINQLIISELNMNTSSLNALSDIIKTNKISNLSLEKLFIENSNIFIINDALKYNTSLTHLKLLYNKAHHLSIIHITNELESNQSIQELDLYVWGENIQTIESMCRILKNNLSIKQIHFTTKDINDDELTKILCALKDNMVIKIFRPHLWNMNIKKVTFKQKEIQRKIIVQLAINDIQKIILKNKFNQLQQIFFSKPFIISTHIN